MDCTLPLILIGSLVCGSKIGLSIKQSFFSIIVSVDRNPVMIDKNNEFKSIFSPSLWQRFFSEAIFIKVWIEINFSTFILFSSIFLSSRSSLVVLDFCVLFCLLIYFKSTSNSSFLEVNPYLFTTSCSLLNVPTWSGRLVCSGQLI